MLKVYKTNNKNFNVMAQSAREIFTSIVGGKNFMTPKSIKFLKIPNGAVEISSGKGFSGNTIYGVTVVKDGEHNHGLSKCVFSLEEAERYVNHLKKL